MSKNDQKINKNIDKKKYKKALDFTYKIHFKQNT